MQKNNSHKVSLIVGIFIAVCLGIVVANIFGGFVQGLMLGLLSSLTPIITALVVVFILKHVMAYTENKVIFKLFPKLSKVVCRAISLSIAVILMIGFLALVFYLFVPKTVGLITELVNNKEIYIYQLQEEISALLSSIFGSSADDIVAKLTDSLYENIEKAFNDFLPQLVSIGTSTIATIGQILLGFVLAVIYLFNREKVNKFMVRIARVKMKPESIKHTKHFLDKSDRILIDFIIAKVIECIVITICLGIIMSLLGVSFEFELAFIIGILNVIPYVGYIISLLPTTLITMVYGSVSLALQTLIFVSVAYIFITSFITPIIVGRRVKMNMLVMFLSMIIGGGIMGMWGMMIGIPIGAIISELVVERVEYKENQIVQAEQETDILSQYPADKTPQKVSKKGVSISKTSKTLKISKKQEKEDETGQEIEEAKSTKNGRISKFLEKIKYNFSNIAPEEDENNDDTNT